MNSKNKRPMDTAERAYVDDVKRLPCLICGLPAPSEAHEPEQGLWFLAMPLCKHCHGGPGYPHGWHGDKSRWRAAKMTELKAINETRRRVEQLRSGAQVHPRRNMISVPAPKRKGSALTSDKILRHVYAPVGLKAIGAKL